MAKRKTETRTQDEYPPEAVGMGIVRCPDCGLLHIGILDEDDNAICEMSMDDAEALSIALKLLSTIFPSIKTTTLVERIKAASSGPVTH